MNRKKPDLTARWRHILMLGVFAVVALLLLGRGIYLQHHTQEFLAKAGSDFQQREVSIPVYRGTITDRNGELLAVSVPMYAVWVNPKHLNYKDDSIERMATHLSLNPDALRRRVEDRREKQFVYVKRQVISDEAEILKSLKLPGVYFKRESRRYYPMGEAAAHLIGVTDIDEVGIEGAERVFDSHLRGKSGAKRVWQDQRGRIVHHELMRQSRAGNDLVLSIDKRIQYHAHRLLKLAMHTHKAKAGSIVVLDAKSGEILAMTNTPSFNPNDRSVYEADKRRNRAAIDAIEAGSAIKPFILGGLLDKKVADSEYGRIDLEYPVETGNGYAIIEGKEIKDIHGYGTLSAWDVIVKSSNIGISKLALKMEPADIWETLDVLGFGQMPGTGFPGEAEGRLIHHTEWEKIDWVSISHGYGLSASPLQMAHAYTAIANDGWQPTPVLYKSSYDEAALQNQVFKPDTAQQLRRVLQDVVIRGTARKAKVDGFTSAGKTGTVRKYKESSYSEDYFSIFVGFAPATQPKLVAAVVIDSPNVGGFYGGQVAAPIFSDLAGHALRILGVAEDDATSDSYGIENYMLTQEN